MDSLYRRLHVAFGEAIRNGEYELDEDFRTCCEAMERLYKGWFLTELLQRWTQACEADLQSVGHVHGIPQQLDFCMSEVEPVVRDKKRAWVIVSDALRYEVATSLGERLERETRGVCELGAVQSVFPSITKTGMSALLPVNSFAYEESVSADGKTSFTALVNGAEAGSCATRQAALRTRFPHAVAVRFDDFFNEMSGAERKELVGDAQVVYIYHNIIDATGDKPTTERRVFTACDEAIDDLTSCVRTLVREFKAARVVVTADHGFLYTSESIAETDHASLADVAGTVVEAGRRYVIAREGATAEPLMPVALPASASQLAGFTPRACVRIRMAGGGENYVHGGISLQEMCVPVLRFTNKRAGSKGYVESAPATISLVTQIDTISNSLFTLQFLQNEPAVGKTLPATYEIFVGDLGHNAVTDTARVVADSAEPQASARQSRVELNLRPGVTTSESQLYRLYARNAQTGAIEALRDLHIRVAFAPTTDFGW